MSVDHIKDVLFTAGPQWGERSPDDIINALHAAGYAIVPREATTKMYCAALDEYDALAARGTHESYSTIWRVMVNVGRLKPSDPAPS